MTEDIPEVPLRSDTSKGLSGASVVWLVPLAALLVALFVAVTTYNDRGPVVQISFADAAGILPNETELRFRNVPVGLVERVAFNTDLTRVLVDVRLDKSVAPFVDADAAFWIVRPEVTTTGVTGLETVLSGVYVEGSWDTDPGGVSTAFVGLDQAPLQTVFRSGTQIELRSTRARGLAENTPILFKGIEVGQLGSARISQNGRFVFAQAVIYEPHDKLVSTATRFWDASGFSVSIGPNGAELDFSSLASLIAGGITFDTLVSGGQPIRDGLVFEVFPSEAAARTSIFDASDGETVTLTMIFNENVSGLATEASDEWRGVRIGRVVNVTGAVDEARFGDARVRLLTTVEITPARFGIGGDLSEDDALAYLAARVEEGLRARLATASILTGGLKIELLSVPNAPPAALDLAAEPFPLFPVTGSDVADVAATAEGVFERVNALPVEELLDSAIAFLDNATALVASDDLRETPGELRGLLTDARGVIGSDEVQELPGELGALVADLQGASGDLRAILAEMRAVGAVERVLAALDAVALAAGAADAALADVPELVGRVSTFVEGANALPLDAMVTEASSLAAQTRALVSAPETQQIPGTLSAALAELSAILAAFAEADTPASLDAALQDAGAAAQAIEASVAEVPAVVARLDRIVASAEEVELATLAEELAALLAAAQQLFGEASEADLPNALAASLAEMERALSDLRRGGLIENANATMASARDAAEAIETAAEDLPRLIARVNTALAQATDTLAEYDADSPFARETSAALREIEQAAEAVTDLARAIERRPNSLLLGR